VDRKQRTQDLTSSLCPALEVNPKPCASTMDSPLEKVGDCFYVDDAGNMYFSVDDFLRSNDLPDSPVVRQAVIEIAEEEFPEMLILEEWN
jgi:hypothetical protein